MMYMASLEKCSSWGRGDEWGVEDEAEGFINIQSHWKCTSAQGTVVSAEDVDTLRLQLLLSCASASASPSDAL